jgi:hypothetical protein
LPLVGQVLDRVYEGENLGDWYAIGASKPKAFRAEFKPMNWWRRWHVWNDAPRAFPHQGFGACAAI